MKKNRIYLIVAFIIIIGVIIWLSLTPSTKQENTIMVTVEYGSFEIDVTTTGELEAKESEKIMGPSNLRAVRIWRVTIEDIINDGTVVDSGDYVATLDRTELMNKIKDEELELEKLQTQFTKTQLDTTMELRAARDELVNLKYNLEEKQIVVDQSVYEPPATQRQAKIDLDKAKRAYEQAVENYQLKLEKAKANMQEVTTSLKKATNKIAEMNKVLEGFEVRAPKAGMVIYRRGWDGKKMGVGAQVSSWDPVVATLPNLTKMISKTYVNEIDISKVKPGQQVEIGVDAFPEKQYTGEVREVANIGQQMRNSNAKVFEVIIDVNEYDSILRPAMTTKNRIITAVMDSVLFIPIECIQSNDSLTYVYTSDKKRQVISGQSNENEIVILAGLEKGEEIYLVAPDDAEDYRYDLLDTAIINKYETIIEKVKQQDTIIETPKENKKVKTGKKPGRPKQITNDAENSKGKDK